MYMYMYMYVCMYASMHACISPPTRSHQNPAISVTHVVSFISVSNRVWILGASDIDTSLFSTRVPDTRMRVGMGLGDGWMG